MSFGDGCLEDAPRYPEESAREVFERQRDEIAALKRRVLQRVIVRVRGPWYYCAECHKPITRHAAQTEDGFWHHLGCLTKAPSFHYQAEDVRVLGAPWHCGECGHYNGPDTGDCVKCGKRAYERV